MNGKDYYIKLQAKIDSSSEAIAALNTQINTLSNKVSKLTLKLDVSENAKDLDNLKQKIESLKNSTNTTSGSSKGFSDLDSQLNKLKVSMGEFKTNLLSTDSTVEQIKNRYTNNAGKMLTVTERLVDGQKKYKVALKEVYDSTEFNAKQADKWNYSWSKAFQSFTTYMSVSTIFYQAVRGIRSMIDNVVELDDALVELKKVTDLSGESLEKFTEDAYDVGEEVAKTGKEMIEAATSFAKAGYSEEQVLQLGKVASMYTNIADEEISAADAADFIIAQLKAFNLESENINETLENSYHIIDAVNEVSNNFAVSSSDIATNLGKASSVMANAGNSLEEMIGLNIRSNKTPLIDGKFFRDIINQTVIVIL